MATVRPATYGVLGFVLVSSLVTLDRLDGALSVMHTPEHPAGGFGSVASPAALFSTDNVIAVTAGWLAYEGLPARTGVEVGDVTRLYVLVDCVGVALALALLVGLFAARSRAGLVTGGNQHRAHRAMLGFAIWCAGFYLAADLAETTATAAWWEGLGSGQAKAIGLFALAKWILLALAVLAVGSAQLGVDAARSAMAGALSALRHQTVSLRAQLLILLPLTGLFIALSGDLGRQIDDVLARGVERFWPMAFGVLAAVGASLMVFASGRDCLDAYRSPPTVPAVAGTPPPKPSNRWWYVTWVAGLVIFGAGLLLLLKPGFVVRSVGNYTAVGAGLLPIGVFLLLLAVLSIPPSIRHYTAKPAETGTPSQPDLTLLWTLTGTPLFILSLSFLRTAVTQWTGKAQYWWLTTIVSVLTVVLAVGVPLLLARRVGQSTTSPSVGPSRRRIWMWLGASLGCLVALGLVDPVWVRHVGTLAVLYVAAGVLIAFTTALVLLGDARAPTGALALTGLRRRPFLTLLVIWLVSASLIDRQSPYHDARLMEEQGAAGAGQPVRMDPTLAFDHWRAVHAPVRGQPSNQPRQAVPLIFMASVGGGIRAAYWTALVWDCLFGTQARQHPELGQVCARQVSGGHVFAASGVSGGALGVAAIRAQDVDPKPAESRTTGKPAVQTWFDEGLDDDFIASALMAFLFRDVPNSTLRLPLAGWNRDSTLERAWQASQPALAVGLFDAQTVDGRQRFPQLVFTGASVEDGCRLSVSTVTAATRTDHLGCYSDPRTIDIGSAVPPGSRDAYAYLCARNGGTRRDVQLSSAALLSARFPYVSTTGALTNCERPTERTYVLDGGIVDNSGTEALTELWGRIAQRVADNNNDQGRPCIVPQLLLVDNGYARLAKPAAAGRPLQVLAPGASAANVYGGRSAAARQRALAVFAAAHADARRVCGLEAATKPVAVVSPYERPGPRAPLGWTLADYSRQDLRDQLGRTAGCDLERVRRWYGPPPDPSNGAAASRCP